MDMHRRRSVWAWVSLVAVALVCAGAWRAEIEYHGWLGLTWIGYFHWAVPFGVGLFIFWVVFFNNTLTRSLKVIFAYALGGVGLVGVFAASWSLTILCDAGPRTFMRYVMVPSWERTMDSTIAVVWLVSVPVLLASVAHFAGLRMTWRRLALSELIWLGAPLFGMLVIAVFFPHGHAGHPYDPDFIHAIKTGFVIPPLIVALGILFLPRSAEVDR